MTENQNPKKYDLEERTYKYLNFGIVSDFVFLIYIEAD